MYIGYREVNATQLYDIIWGYYFISPLQRIQQQNQQVFHSSGRYQLNPNHPAEPINIQDLKRTDVKHVPKLQRTITPNDPIMKVLMFVFSCHCFKGCKGRCVFFWGMVIYVVVPKGARCMIGVEFHNTLPTNFSITLVLGWRKSSP